MISTGTAITLTADDWMVAQGIVGYYRILRHAGIKVRLTDEGILFDPSHLDNFEQHYFRFFLDKYSVAKRDGRMLQRLWTRYKLASEQSDAKEAKKRIQDTKKFIDDTIKRTAIDKVEKKFPETPATQKLVAAAKQIRSQKTYTVEMEAWLSHYLELLALPEINHKLTLNYFKAQVLGSYFGQVSFLNVLHTAKTLEEQQEIFRKDYIESVLTDLKLQQVLQAAVTAEEVMKHLEQTNHEMASNLKRALKKKSIEQIKEHVAKQINRCSFFDEQKAFEQYSESHFSPLSMSAPKALNFYWGANSDLAIPISKLAKFILFCAPAGASIASNSSLFVHLDGTFEALLRANDTYEAGRNQDKAFDEILFDLVAEQKTKAQQAQKDYLIIEYSSDYSAKKTDLQYLHLTPGLCNFFTSKHCANWFHQLNYTFRNRLVHMFLQYQEPKVLIYQDLRVKLREGYKAYDTLYACLLRYYFLAFTKGENTVTEQLELGRKRIWSAFYAGAEMRGRMEEGKIRSIAYRLLNAVRSNDKNMFLDTAMRLYLSAEQPLPTVFMNILDESQVDFPSIADSFVAGLISGREEKGDTKND